MATIEQLKEQIDLHELAERLDLERPQAGGNYRSPRHDDKSPSLNISADGKFFKDWSREGDEHSAGSCIDLVIWCGKAQDVGEAIKKLHEWYGIPFDRPARADEPRTESLAEFIAKQSLENTAPAVEYLTGRGIAESVVMRAIKKRSVGFNDWHSGSKAPGEFGYGGPAVAFIVRSMNPGRVVAVDMRYLDPDLNGGTKTQTQGEKIAVPWINDPVGFKKAETVYVVESAINVLSIETAGLKNTSAFALRGLSNAQDIDLRFLKGKRVIICMDADEEDENGKRPGPEAGWILHERLTSLNIVAHMVDQLTWYEKGYNDVNDILQAEGDLDLVKYLKHLEECAIAGLIGGQRHYPGRSRVWLPGHDLSHYYKYRTKEDFTTLIKIKKDESGEDMIESTDLCSFRIAGLSRVTITSPQSAIFGGDDASPVKKTVVTAQVPGENQLVRHVFDDAKLHKVDKWEEFGYVFNRSAFMRLIAILKRASHIGARVATNVVGIGWHAGKTVVREGPDCYFEDPQSQCPYSNLLFPSGTRADAKSVVLAYHKMFKGNAALLVVVWAMGAYLKAWLRFWPHLVLQAKKDSGKSTLNYWLSNSFAMDIRGGQALNTSWRLLTSVSHSTHPIIWEELSTRSKQVIADAVKMLQEAYNCTTNPRGKPVLNYAVCTPVLIAGEDVPVDSLIGKTVRSDIDNKKGDLPPGDLPKFPLYEWLTYLAEIPRDRIENLFARTKEYARKHCMADTSDNGATRIVDNYAALLCSWRLLEEFCGLPKDQLGFVSDCIAEMNAHISETKADRQPWVWVLQTIFGEISSNNYSFPYKFVNLQTLTEDKPALLIRSTHMVQHISTQLSLRALFDELPVKSDRALKKLLVDAGVVLKERVTTTINNMQHSHMMALDLDKLREYYLHVSRPVELETQLMTDGDE